MRKRNCVIGVLVLGLVAQTSALAASKSRAPDGCTQLAASVRIAVYQAVQGGSSFDRQAAVRRSPASGQIAASPGGATSCSETTRVTTEAFATTFAEIGLPIDWGDFPPDPGDFCESFYLSQCYPRTTGTSATMSAAQLHLINDTWKAVGKSVTGFMPYGIASNLSRFEVETLRLSLLGAVAVYVDAPEFPRVLPRIEQYDAF